MKGTSLPATAPTRLTPPTSTMPAKKSRPSAVPHSGTCTVLARFTLMELAWTMAPMPKQAIIPNTAKDVASQI